MEELRRRLQKELDGEVLFDEFSLGRYSSDSGQWRGRDTRTGNCRGRRACDLAAWRWHVPMRASGR
jgi:hypothetical protein